jgi:hypothetical protein
MSYNPLENQASRPQPQGTAQGNANPLARLAAPLPGLPPPLPAPTAAQATAAVRRLSAVADAMRTVMNQPDFGRANCRPAILDEASKLIGAGLVSLPQIMESIKALPDDPMAQRSYVAGIYNQAKQAEANVLAHHTAALAMGMVPRNGGEKYQAADHDRHMSGLMGHYPNPKA